MRSFAIDEPGSSVRALYATLDNNNNNKLILKSFRQSLGVCICGCNNFADAKTIGSLPTLHCTKHSITTWLKTLFPIGYKSACIYDAFLDWNVSTKKSNFQNIFEVWDFILAPLKFSSFLYPPNSKFQISNYKLQTTNYKLQITKLTKNYHKTTNYKFQRLWGSALRTPSQTRSLSPTMSKSSTVSSNQKVTLISTRHNWKLFEKDRIFSWLIRYQ